MCDQRPWPWRWDLESRSWRTIESCITIVWNIIKIQNGSKELWPRPGFWTCVHSKLEIENITLVKGQDTPFGHGQQLCILLSTSNMGVRSYGLENNFWSLSNFWNFFLAQDHWWGFSTQNAHMVQIVNQIRFKIVNTSLTFRSWKAIFLLRQPLVFLFHISYGMPGFAPLMNVLL